ncbi:MAG: VWA domain-containing protein, partial [Acidobacteria bacterium]|nr:VWA domain-containing protein [Acidobacteriota bacterium]NIM61785.1 VWA domain-containing protein [Acidobacteriota bacterium]NIO60029.1 VWA domain-containing protein [Acidobacteriota bacterium]NIQ29221.1 VWA domain-containing protein [Acidobacteriota bacterium]NIQ83795.1 VWA domain-containing protein [Acidobacteriota bacterium]
WEDSGIIRTDLNNIHVDGVYTDINSIGLPPQMSCDWFIDGLGTDSNPALLVDRSGSMNYDDESLPEAKAIELAFDAAIYFYNRVPVGKFAGVYTFNTGVSAATAGNGGLSFPFEQKVGALASFDVPIAELDTNIGDAIALATSHIDGAVGVPKSTRDIVIFSDGKHNDPNAAINPYDAAKAACDLGINVHTIAYGNADSMALRRIALCGEHWATGTENAGDPLYGEPDPLEIKTSIARMGHSIA